MNTHVQDPNETLDYSVDWAAALLAGETIASSLWTVETGDVELGSGPYAATQDDTSATVWISGGTVGGESKVTNRIETDSTPPRIFERSIYIMTREA